MKYIYTLLTLMFLAFWSMGESHAQDNSAILTGPYLGQKAPGLTPEVFASGVVSTKGWEVGGVFTPKLNEFYFIRNNKKSEEQEIVVFKNINNQWHESIFSPRLGTPFFSPDGNTMHLGRRYRERTETGWTELKMLAAPFAELPIMRLSASAKKTYYFDEFKSDLTGDIRYSRLVNGKYEEPKLLGKTINSGRSFHPFIAADESYLIFDSKREGGYGDSDLYICFRKQDGSWGKAINLGDKINTESWEALASVTPDGKYLFFNRNMSPGSYENVDIFWVDAQFIDALRPKE
ncbi:hypothetical protein [Aliikangiella maris]|uniref:Uncharacterized protein n=2 Tax=Aliikangiella maris TaxID=3162458 RepID=A0ABV3MTP9_9GAMM